MGGDDDDDDDDDGEITAIDLYGPWFAIALRAGHEQRLSPCLGGTYSGQTPPSPGWPLGVTWPTLRLKVKRLTTQRDRSQSMRPVKKAPW